MKIVVRQRNRVFIYLSCYVDNNRSIYKDNFPFDQELYLYMKDAKGMYYHQI